MTDLIKPLSHSDVEKKDDATLASEAAAFLNKNPAIHVVCELLTKLREMSLPWWTPKHLRLTYSASDRMRWYAQRPDLRQKITTELTGLAPKASRRKAPDFQAGLIDSVIDDADISVEDFEVAYEPADLAVYGPAGDFWRLFRRRMPWDDDATEHQDLVGWLIGALLNDKSSLDGSPRKAVLTAWDVRTAIDGRVWHTRIPLDVRVAIDEARFRQQKDSPRDPFHAQSDLAIAAPALIAASLPLKDLTGVLDVAGRAMGFEADTSESRDSQRHSTPPAAARRDSRAPEAEPSEREDRTIVGPAQPADEDTEGPPSIEIEDEMEVTNTSGVDDEISSALDALTLQPSGDGRRSKKKRG